jgi:hypothetical protein
VQLLPEVDGRFLTDAAVSAARVLANGSQNLLNFEIGSPINPIMI